MCDPVSMAVMTVASGFMQYQQAQTQAAAVKQEGANAQKIAEFNAQQNELAADDAVRRGANEAGDIRERTRMANATARTRMAGSGLLSDTGTNLDLQAQNAQYGEFNALTALNNAEREAYGFKSQAQSSRFSGQVAKSNAQYQAKAIRQNGLLNMTGTFITGARDFGTSQGWFTPKK